MYLLLSGIAGVQSNHIMSEFEKSKISLAGLFFAFDILTIKNNEDNEELYWKLSSFLFVAKHKGSFTFSNLTDLKTDWPPLWQIDS